MNSPHRDGSPSAVRRPAMTLLAIAPALLASAASPAKAESGVELDHVWIMVSP